jgi:hypothetical protein
MQEMAQVKQLIKEAESRYKTIAAYTSVPGYIDEISFSVYFRESELVLNDKDSFVNIESSFKTWSVHTLNSLNCALCTTITSHQTPSIVRDKFSGELRTEISKVFDGGPFLYTVQKESDLDYPKVLMIAGRHIPQYHMVTTVGYLGELYAVAYTYKAIIHIPGKDSRRFPITHAYAYLTRHNTLISHALKHNPNTLPMNTNVNLKINYITCRVFRYKHFTDINREASHYVETMVQDADLYSNSSIKNMSFTLFKDDEYFLIVYLAHNIEVNKGTANDPKMWKFTPYTGIVEIDETSARQIVENRDSPTVREQIQQTITGEFAHSYITLPNQSNSIFKRKLWRYNVNQVNQDFSDALKWKKYSKMYDMFQKDQDLSHKVLNDVTIQYILTNYTNDPDIRAFLLTRWLKEDPTRIASRIAMGFFIQDARNALTEFEIDAETFIDGAFPNIKKMKIMKGLHHTSLTPDGYSSFKVNEWLSIINKIEAASSFGMVYIGNVGKKVNGDFVPKVPIVIKGLTGGDKKIITRYNYDNNRPSFIKVNNTYVETLPGINWKANGYRPIGVLPDGLLQIARLTNENIRSAKYETGIGLTSINLYRSRVPNFMMTYGSLLCPTYVPDMQTPNNTAMCADGPSGTMNEPFIIIESFGTKTEKAKSMNDILNINANPADMSDILLRTYIQLFSALQIARDINKFRHNDLHEGNVMYVKTPRNENNPKDPMFRYVFGDDTHVDVLAPYFCMVIDFGMAEAINYNPHPVNGRRWMQVDRSYIPQDPNLDNPMNDIWTFVFSMFVSILQDTPGLVTRGTHPNRYFDPTKSKIAEFYKIFFDAYKGGSLKNTVFIDGPPDLSINTPNLFIHLMREVGNNPNMFVDTEMINWYLPAVKYHIYQMQYNNIDVSRMRYNQPYKGITYDLSTHKGIALLANSILNLPITDQQIRTRYMFGMHTPTYGRTLPRTEWTMTNDRRLEMKDITDRLIKIDTSNLDLMNVSE